MNTISLPSEMLDSIFEFLSRVDVKTAANILTTSKRYSEIIRNNGNTKYNITMGVNGIENKTPVEQFGWACGRGSVEIMEIIRNKYKITSDDIKSNGCNAVISACVNGHMKITEELIKEYEIDFKKDIANVDYFLELTFIKGHEESLTWLLEKLRKNYDNNSISFLYDDVCKKGYLNAVKFLTDRIRFEEDDKINAFRMACWDGHIELAKFFVGKFELNAEVIKSGLNAGLRYACREGHPEIAEWIAGTFGLSRDETFMHLDWYKAITRALRINLCPRVIKVLEKYKM